MNVALAVLAVFGIVLGLWGSWRAWESRCVAEQWAQQCEIAEQNAVHWFDEHKHVKDAMAELMQRRAEEKRKARESAQESARKGWETRRKVEPLREAA